MSVSSTDRIVEDLRRVIDDAEALLRKTATFAGDRIDVARERVSDAAHETDRYVRKNPWQSVGIAAGVGLILGVLLSRR